MDGLTALHEMHAPTLEIHGCDGRKTEAVRFPCPCCGYLTLDHVADGSYDICPVCFWEDDWVQNRDTSYAGGANEPSLDEAKTNFAAFGAIEERFIPRTRPPTDDEQGTAD